jgi:hypothetical protein
LPCAWTSGDQEGVWSAEYDDVCLCLCCRDGGFSSCFPLSLSLSLSLTSRSPKETSTWLPVGAPPPLINLTNITFIVWTRKCWLVGCSLFSGCAPFGCSTAYSVFFWSVFHVCVCVCVCVWWLWCGGPDSEIFYVLSECVPVVRCIALGAF